MSKNKHSNPTDQGAKPPVLSYLCRRPFTFEGRRYEPGEVFDHPGANGAKLASMVRARRLELAHVVAQRKREGRGKRREAKVTHNPQVG